MEKKLILSKDFQISASEELFKSSDTLKHKAMYFTDFHFHKYGPATEPKEDRISNDFWTN